MTPNSTTPLAVRLARVAFPASHPKSWRDGPNGTVNNGIARVFDPASLDSLAICERRVVEAGFEWELAEYLGMVLIERRGTQSSGCQAFAQADERTEALRRLLDANPELERRLGGTASVGQAVEPQDPPSPGSTPGDATKPLNGEDCED